MLWTSVVALVPGEAERHGLITKGGIPMQDPSYLGESARRDAFAALIAVLRRRILEDTREDIAVLRRKFLTLREERALDG